MLLVAGTTLRVRYKVSPGTPGDRYRSVGVN